MIRSPNYQKYLQDPIVTIREGRYVVPVKVEYRSQVPGIVHDQSASGATLFIEPMAVVEKNNELKRLMVAEKQEVLRILGNLTAGVARNAESIQIALEALGEFDFIMARSQVQPEAGCLGAQAGRRGRYEYPAGQAPPFKRKCGAGGHPYR